jgi:hypothetical protein
MDSFEDAADICSSSDELDYSCIADVDAFDKTDSFEFFEVET